MAADTAEEDGRGMRSTKLLALPAGLEELAVARFDELVAKEQLIYEDSTAETVEDQGFKVNFRFAPHLQRKPITPADAPERKTGKGGHNPFLNPTPSEVLSPIGPSHTLLVNKFSVYRPSLLLITRNFVPQKDGLHRDDLAAAWSVLKHFDEPYMMIYNCGFESGSSQGHKHMQLWPTGENELDFKLFPTKAKSDVDVTSDIPQVPYKHFVLRLTKDADLDTLVQAYDKLVSRVREAHKEAGGGHDYNVILVKEWMCMIPRQHSGLDRGAGANSAAMLGLVWTVTEKEREVWDASGPVEYYKYLGIPR